ncbi:cysteine-rich venom protein helothermine-like [Elgaria multicarinata webbii]|uniref:cysteine-rich venom protein helothermine-like n=1 Tax=Elgaria multicarinata webbii TaxID=159646 RepID=UPI002FCD1E16
MTNNAVIQSNILNMHNKLRRKVKPTASNMLRMSWSPTVADSAQRWANQCSLKHSSEETRKINGQKCGENIYMAPALFSWSRVMKEWHDDEVKIFRFGTGPTAAGMVGHYTQIVWYNSRELGCALAYCPHQAKHKYFYVCHYCPTFVPTLINGKETKAHYTVFGQSWQQEFELNTILRHGFSPSAGYSSAKEPLNVCHRNTGHCEGFMAPAIHVRHFQGLLEYTVL